MDDTGENAGRKSWARVSTWCSHVNQGEQFLPGPLGSQESLGFQANLLPVGIQNSLPNTNLVLNSLCCLLRMRLGKVLAVSILFYKRQDLNWERPAALQLGFYAFYTCCCAEKDSVSSCGLLNNKVIKAAIFRRSMQEVSGEMKGQACNIMKCNIS